MSEISSCGSPLNPLSNPTSLIEILFFKKVLCPISHNDLIIDYFNRENLYKVSRVTILTFGPENDTQLTKIHPLSITIYEILIQCSERKL